MQSEQSVGLLLATQLNVAETKNCGAACRALLEGLNLPASTPAYAATLEQCDEQAPVTGPIVCVVSHPGLSLHNFEASLSRQPPERLTQCVTAMIELEANLEASNQHNQLLQEEVEQSSEAAEQAHRQLVVARTRILELESTVVTLQQASKQEDSVTADHSHHEQVRRQEAMWRGRLAEVQRGHDQVVNSLMEQLASTTMSPRRPRDSFQLRTPTSTTMSPRHRASSEYHEHTQAGITMHGPPRVPHLKLSSGGVLRPPGGSPASLQTPDRPGSTAANGSQQQHASMRSGYGSRGSVHAATTGRGSLTPRGTSPRLVEAAHYEPTRAEGRGNITPRGTSQNREAAGRPYADTNEHGSASQKPAGVQLQPNALVKSRDSRLYTLVDRNAPPEDRAKRLQDWRTLQGQGRMSTAQGAKSVDRMWTKSEKRNHSAAPTPGKPRWAF